MRYVRPFLHIQASVLLRKPRAGRPHQSSPSEGGVNRNLVLYWNGTVSWPQNRNAEIQQGMR